MEDYYAVIIKHINIETGDKINNLIQINQLNYNINKNINCYTIDFLINNYDLDLNDLIYNNLYETFCIITEDDYKSLIGLLYNDSKELVNYNDNYYIIEILSHFKFKGNQNMVNTVGKKFVEYMQKK